MFSPCVIHVISIIRIFLLFVDYLLAKITRRLLI